MTFERKDPASRLRDLLEKVAVEHELPGFAASVSQAGCEIFADGFGTCDADGLLPVTADTMFGVASVTKFLTVIIIMQAQEQQLLRLSDPVSQFYPLLDCARDGRMRLHHLLTHTAGFPGLPFRHSATDNRTRKAVKPKGNNVAGPLLTSTDLVSRINALDFNMLGSPGEHLSYSNESYCLLGGIVEGLYQCPFAEAAEKFVFQPLKMDRSAIGGTNLHERTNIASPLLRSEAGLRQSEFWEAPLFHPAGGLIISVRDMVRLISTLDGDTDVLTSGQSQQMISEPVPVASRPSRKVGYGLGLELEYLDADNTLAWHTGQRPGISSFIGHIVQKKISVALAVNVGDAPTAAIGHEIIAHVLAGELDSSSSIWPLPADSVMVRQTEQFSGCYGSSEMGEFRVDFQQNRLLLRMQPVTHEFRFEGPYNGTVGGYTFCFLDEDGNEPSVHAPTALALDLRILPRLKAG